MNTSAPRSTGVGTRSIDDVRVGRTLLGDEVVELIHGHDLDFASEQFNLRTNISSAKPSQLARSRGRRRGFGVFAGMREPIQRSDPRERQHERKMDDIFFEDVVPGAAIRAGPYTIPEHELLAFGATWDPLPIHVDKAFASMHGGLTAPGIYLLAIKMRLVHSLPLRRSVIASFGYDEVRFHRPARPGDELMLELKWSEKRRSRSKPDRGIVTGRYSLINAAGEVVLSHLDTVLMRLRSPGLEIP
jgi:acyl dehydratase